MFGFGRNALYAVIAAAALACGSAAKADTVTFNVVSGTFGSDSASAATYTTSGLDFGILPYSVTAKVSFTANTSPISFNMTDGQTQAITAPSLGSFHVDVSSTGLLGSFNDVAINDTFSLTIQVTSPTSASGTTTGILSGTLEKLDRNDDLTIQLNSLSIPGGGLPDLVFAFNKISLSDVKGEDTGSLTGSVTYYAAGNTGPSVTAVPFPSAAAVGGSFLAVLGLVAGVRKMGSPR